MSMGKVAALRNHPTTMTTSLLRASPLCGYSSPLLAVTTTVARFSSRCSIYLHPAIHGVAGSGQRRVHFVLHRFQILVCVSPICGRINGVLGC
ncbi:unnamed protein product [Cuscuta epithymum]|uniref:Uncharacterized protein n=1 Tax=Cuscuta epithymum TaxID=186058 RepID=A0AAV0FDL3_9ASTE|nr:unnamed protein product [Cuscuta epithymum]